MSLMLDTSVLINLERRERRTVGKIEDLQRKISFKPYTAFFNQFEFLIGIKEKSPKNREKAKRFLTSFEILHTTDRTSEIMSDLKYKYDKKGILISISDLIIASLAIENGMALVTSDEDFKHIEELRLEFIG